jgi:tRNA A-37 threonylcarbamoyl transferase component Bud32/thioredoxin-like negative regulator of GroEL
MNDSTPSIHCPRCGAALPADAPEGLCPRCLAALPFGPETAFTGDLEAAPLPALSPVELAPHFPQLEILECLGRGGMGVVYKARQKSLHRLVALKLLAPERANDAEFAQRFAREAQALAALNHPHIVTIYDFGEAGGFYFLLMEFVDGVNLRQAMNAKRFTPQQALVVVPPICEALQYAHEHGIVHRDIKPENLLLDKDGRVKIADFGVAKMLGDEPGVVAADSQPAGTPQYMAPEQKEHQRTDHRADIYSLGVVLYEMLTGERPKDRIEPPSHRVQVDVRIDEIVLRALEKTPELRFQTAAEMRTHLETLAAPASRPPAPQTAGTPASSTIPLLVFAVVFGVYAFYLASTFEQLPERPAVHFGFAGKPDRWMSRSGYLGWGAVFPLFFVGLFWLVSQFAKWCPALVNIPRKDYWLAPERCAQTATFLFRRLLWLASIETVFFGALHGLVVAANRQTPPQLPLAPLTIWIIAFFLVILMWIVTLMARLAEAEHGGPQNPPSRTPRADLSKEMPAGSTSSPPASQPQTFFHTLGFSHPGGQRLLVVSLLGFLGFLGAIPGWERELFFLWFLALLPMSSFLEWWLARAEPVSESSVRRSRRRQWSNATILIVALLLTRTLLLGQYIVSGDSAAPEIPAGSHILVWKMSRSFAHGDMAAYRQDGRAYVGRVVKSLDASLILNRNSQPDETIPRPSVIGKVISVYWRGTPRSPSPLAEDSGNAAIGIALARKDGRFFVGSLVPNAPASLDGRLQPGDEIVSFGDSLETMKSAAGQSMNECVKRMRGPLGSPITLRVIPAGRTAAETYELTLTRQWVPVLEADRLGQLGSPHPVASATPDPETGAQVAQQAWHLWQSGQLADAVRKFGLAVLLAPEDANAWNGLGWAHLNSGHTAAAETAFQKSLTLAPNAAGPLNGLGQLYLSQRAYEKAEPFLSKAASQPGASAAWFGLARLYLLEGKFEEAEKWAQMVVDSGQGDAIATKMLEAAKEKRLSEGLRQTIEPAAANSKSPAGN